MYTILFQCEIINMNIYDLTYEEDHSALFNLLSNPPIIFSVMDKEVPRGELA